MAPPAASVLHLPLRKKESSWLLRNSRPVLLEPFLRRAGASVVFRRLLRRMELSGLFPPANSGYLRQMRRAKSGAFSSRRGRARGPTCP